MVVASRNSRIMRSIWFLVDFAAAGDAPNGFDALAADAVDFVVHVDGAANVIGNDRESIADAILSFGAGDVQMAVFFGEAFDFHSRVVFDESEAAAVFGLITIRRKCF